MIDGLPTEIIWESDDPDYDPDEELADDLSDEYGWAIEGFCWESVEPGAE